MDTKYSQMAEILHILRKEHDNLSIVFRKTMTGMQNANLNGGGGNNGMLQTETASLINT